MAIENNCRKYINNNIVTGYPQLDDILDKRYKPRNIWKSHEKIKIIWSPHHSIEKRKNLNSDEEIELSTFVENSQLMIDLAKKYQNKIQFCLKPHPLLKFKLYNLKGWGNKKTDEYFKLWQNLPNTQLFLSDYKDIFLTSDALINDSASFIAEYLCINKPSLFLYRNKETINQFNEFGKRALECSYKAYNESDIIKFIENIIINKNDNKAELRNNFINKYLVNKGTSASENIFNYVKKECKIDD
jgi:CDP-glycerol glycerophosphotransferase (TagB/SpsB family)